MDGFLSLLRRKDTFNLASFNTDMEFWKQKCFLATKENVEDARKWVSELKTIEGSELILDHENNLRPLTI